MKKLLAKTIDIAESIHLAILSSRVLVSAASLVLLSACRSLEVLHYLTEQRIRLYTMEGKHLSHRKNPLTRMTWYSQPSSAIDVGEYSGCLTGRLVYIDLEISATSSYTYRHYKRGDAAYTLTGDLMTYARRNWKYVELNVKEVSAGEE